jgi:hypothetical protein
MGSARSACWGGRILFKMKALLRKVRSWDRLPLHLLRGRTLRMLEVIANVQEYQDPIQFRSAGY